jgi:hypothetical protein
LPVRPGPLLEKEAAREARPWPGVSRAKAS